MISWADCDMSALFLLSEVGSMHDIGALNLSMAIVKSAIRDWERARNILAGKTARGFSVFTKTQAKETVKEIDQWFHSEDCAWLVPGDPIAIWTQAKKNYEEHGKCFPWNSLDDDF